MSDPISDTTDFEAALRLIVRREIKVQEGSSGHPVLWKSEACVIASEALGMTRDELLMIAREEAANGKR